MTRIEAADYGHRCLICKRVGDTVAIKMPDTVIYICHRCLQDSEFSLELNLITPKPAADRVKIKERKQRIRSSHDLESRLAESVGGRRQPGSGNVELSGAKGDVRVQGKLRIEHKFTDNERQWPLKLSYLSKISDQATGDEIPVLVVEFKKAGQSFAVIPLQIFLEMVNESKDDKRTGGTERRRNKRSEIRDPTSSEN